ncbi:MAG: M3 family metallopeptidase [Myxococcaceae bacterium]
MACATSQQTTHSDGAALLSSSERSVPKGSALLVAGVKDQNAACDQAIAGARASLEKLKTLPKTDVDAVLSAYDDAQSALADASGRAAIAENSHPDREVREAAQLCGQKIEQLATEISLDRGTYDALAGLDLSKQDAATQYWMDRTLKSFRRSGVDRDEETRAKVKELSERLVKIGQEFDQNIREDVRFVEVDPKDLAGLPDDYVSAHPRGASGKVKITTDSPDYTPFLTYAKSAKAREALWRVYRQRGYPKNVDMLSALLKTRNELATLLGYPTWAAYITEDKMIQTPKAASAFIEKVAAASKSRADGDYKVLLERKQKDEPKAKFVDPWDSQYYDDRVKSEKYSLDTQKLRGYFEYNRVRQGVFDITSKMFGLTYKPAKDAPVWHPDIEAYDVYEGGKLLGRFFLDMHPRENKYKHAAQWDLVTGRDGRSYPEAVLMCNFPKPGAQPALMQHSEVETFFHEFGHLLHHILGGSTRWGGISGTRVQHDFVEAPSQLLEEWAWDPDALKTFALHYQTQEPIPAQMVEKMRRAEEFGKGLWVRQQMYYAAISLAFHERDPKTLDTTQVTRELQEKYTPFKYAPETYFQLSFGHLNGYSAVYYTYMWSLVIAKDLFTAFEQEGLLHQAPALRYRRAVLEKGGSKDAAGLVKDFLGRDYAFTAYEKWLTRGG